ncbi:glucosaminylphosphatidylinositol acyltransferase [Marchantia polymorpha subsp. ruderalis]|uniref:GPI-anchored wall transfer protein n=2 Tax=Marchantia polymorpha TaxID=3197 RepID=A0AAF6AKN7_MARPO|nr:hypothetical protein MARPO_0029s0019 [Marchantia polymorpha]BBM97007.1 hypothetical protein Mp_1g02280 [Marchantia polymorpha subsp. ruderalis]|eukprot:PTQ42474.1 hypothetical protein MARPO_0029s0019 [Marchantia polymorpha]
MEFSEEIALAGDVGLKQLKEAFVSNLHGSTMAEIAALTAVVPTFIILRQLGGLILPEIVTSTCVIPSAAAKEDVTSSDGEVKGDRSLALGGPNYRTRLLSDFIFVILPTLACLTVLADWIYIITGFSLVLTLIGVLLLRRTKYQSNVDLYPQVVSKETSSRRTGFLSYFRFTMMLVTCVSILAVDFNVFPRRYAKTETYGTGLMDVGVGSFVVANGLVSRQARNLPPSKYGGVLRNTSPLLVIGFARLILTKGVDYQEHVAEYGVHWNFFFTLAAVALLTSLIHVPAAYCGSLAVVILGGYQASLSFGLNKYLLSSERGPGLISLNKEGVYSIFGYWSMYLISVRLGNYLCCLPERFFSQGANGSSYGKKNGATKWWIVIDVWLLDAIFWLLAIFVDEFIERVSRRMCNLAYVLFVLAQNLEVIAIFLTADSMLPPRVMPLLRIFDQNMLATFLWANILTGLVNMSMQTIFAPTHVAMGALSSYLACLVGGMGIVDALGLKLKFW